MLLDYSLLFSVANYLIIPFWLMLVFIPRHAATQWFIRTWFFQLILALMYVILIMIGFTSGGSEGSFSSLQGMRTLFEADGALLAGWIHYLVFDSFVGIWIVNDAQNKKIPHWHIAVPLFFTFMLGPVGFLMYIVYRSVRPRTQAV